jgi:hypothetical protein
MWKVSNRNSKISFPRIIEENHSYLFKNTVPTLCTYSRLENDLAVEPRSIMSGRNTVHTTQVFHGTYTVVSIPFTIIVMLDLGKTSFIRRYFCFFPSRNRMKDTKKHQLLLVSSFIL